MPAGYAGCLVALMMLVRVASVRSEPDGSTAAPAYTGRNSPRDTIKVRLPWRV